MFNNSYRQSIKLSNNDRNIEIISGCCSTNSKKHLGYKRCYETSDGSNRHEEAVIKKEAGNTNEALVVQGSYSYVGTDGVVYKIIDNGETHSDPVITHGGIGEYFIEITIKPVLLEHLNYNIQVYTQP
ncbi:unnamed protein product [Psylliodes chrysocephalus]|uniref:Uncharacterized protein n=1 Tax=Psylliodes chrysocephalus TaxID=3402493 RepID=A0A9P0CLT8_9CUCU|nr:unnamed protein product [Psylliodes chrysocephala]